MLSTYVQGLAVGMSLIIAIGAQNAFVLKQGLKKQFVCWVCFVCALSDSILIVLGVSGFSKVLEHYPEIIQLPNGRGHFSCFVMDSNMHYEHSNHSRAWRQVPLKSII